MNNLQFIVADSTNKLKFVEPESMNNLFLTLYYTRIERHFVPFNSSIAGITYLDLGPRDGQNSVTNSKQH